ncbi:MAG: putative ABC exporter domain-containing protein, partial [bacterium]|nr:putative ABC exporter domain-containing protein [bacterium]
GAAPIPVGGGPDVMAWIEPFAAPVLAVVVLLAWLLGNSRAALQFTEPETAFLFPAPVSRRTLIHYKLLRGQLGILVSAFFMTLLFRRGSASGHALQQAAGWWVVFSTLNLHFIAASFARQQLFELGLNPWRQRLLVGVALLLLAVAGWWWLPAPADSSSFEAIMAYAQHLLGAPPLSWLLLPFRLVVRPYFAADAGAFFLALGPALLVALAHYFWVGRADVAFEEASLELAAKRAKIVADLREGRWGAGRRAPTKPRPEPFRLRGRGWAPLAFLWQNLVALGPFFRLRTWLIACLAMFALTSWLGADRGRADYLVLVVAFSGMLSLAALLGGPLFMRREVQQTLTQLDITKAYPLAGWQIVLGQLLSPILLLTFLEWFFLLSFILAAGATKKKIAFLVMLGAGGIGGIAFIVPPLVGLLLCLPYAGVLYFPAWAATPPNQAGGAGIEVLGQRLIFMLGYLIVLVVALLPAAAAGGLVWFIAQALIGQITAFILTTLTVSVILGAELTGCVWWLGGKLERFDLSTEMPR